MAKKEKVKPNWSDPSTTAENEKLPGYLKWAWTSRGLSLAINVVLIMQLTYYCTDMIGMPATLVGTLLLVSKLFDGVTDLVVGFIIDKTHTKWGKARPYEICIIFVWLFTIFLFSVPEMGMVGKSVFIFVLYTLINSICATFLNGGDAVYLARSIRSEKNRVSIMSFNGGAIMAFTIVFSILLPQLIAGLGSTKPGWTVIAAVIGIPMGIIGFFRFLFVKEVAADDSSFLSKLGSGMASALVGLVMGMSGYDGSLEVQSAAANTTIIALFNWVPLVLMVVMLILAAAYNLDKLMPKIKEELAKKRAQKY